MNNIRPITTASGIDHITDEHFHQGGEVYTACLRGLVANNVSWGSADRIPAMVAGTAPGKVCKKCVRNVVGAAQVEDANRAWMKLVGF